MPEHYYDDEIQSLYQKTLSMTVPDKLHAAVVGNRMARGLLFNDPNRCISLAVMKNPGLTEDEVLQYAQKKNLPEEMISAISKDSKWIKYYQIKVAIVSNPKCPLSLAIGLLPHLHDKELRFLSRNKEISSVLARAAGQTLLKRIITPSVSYRHNSKNNPQV